MTAKTSQCTLGRRHHWVWQKDITHKAGFWGADGVSIQLSRSGVYQCECGAQKHGEPHSGLELIKE